MTVLSEEARARRRNWKRRAIEFQRGLGIGGASFTPLSLYARGELGDFWDVFDTAKLFENSNGTGVVVADDPVGYIGGQRAAHNMTQGTAANRPLYRGSGATGHLEFDDTNDVLTVASSAALFHYLHDGTGGSLWSIGLHAAGENKFFLGSKNSAGTGIGALLERVDSTSRPRCTIANGTAIVAQATPASGTQWPADTAVMILASFSTGDGLRLYVNGVEVATAAQANTPSTSDSLDLRIPGTPASGPSDARVWGAINRVITPAEALSLYDYYHARGTV